MSIKLLILGSSPLQRFEIDVILDEYQTALTAACALDLFEIDVILDEYQTLLII